MLSNSHDNSEYEPPSVPVSKLYNTEGTFSSARDSLNCQGLALDLRI